MRNNKLVKFQIVVMIVAIILGTLLHFTYEWSGGNSFVASFSATNESVWEHLKLVFFPMLILSIFEYFFVNNITNNYIEAKTIGIFVAISFVVVFFYTYTGILGTNFFVIDILTFIVSIIIGEYVAYKLLILDNQSSIATKILSAVIVVFLLLAFIIFTYNPPKANLFRDPTILSGKFI